MNTKEVIQARNEWLKSMLMGNMLKYRGLPDNLVNEIRQHS